MKLAHFPRLLAGFCGRIGLESLIESDSIDFVMRFF